MDGDPWAIQPEALGPVLDQLARPSTQARAPGQPDPSTALERHALSTRAEQGLSGRGRARVRDGVAIVSLFGPIFRHANFLTSMGYGTSLAAFAIEMAAADADPAIRGILIEVDSPGGTLAGLHGAAALVRAVASRKPVVAYVEGMMASGAYQIGAATREIVTSPTAVLGSLGVVMTLTDRRGADARAGIRRHEFVSSQTPGKRPDPETDEGRGAVQELADALAREFLADIAQSRATTVEALIAATGAGGLIIGRDAVARGLADRIGGHDETLARLTAGNAPAPRSGGQAASAPGPIAALAQPIVAPVAGPSSPQPSSPRLSRPPVTIPATPVDRGASHYPMTGTLRQRALAFHQALETHPMTEGLPPAAIDRHVLIIALQDLAASKGGTISGTADALFPALMAGASGIAADHAAPTCGSHLDHLLRELAASSKQLEGLEVTALRKAALSIEWHISATRAG